MNGRITFVVGFFFFWAKYAEIFYYLCCCDTTTLYSEKVLSQFCAWRLNQLFFLLTQGRYGRGTGQEYLKHFKVEYNDGRSGSSAQWKVYSDQNSHQVNFTNISPSKSSHFPADWTPSSRPRHVIKEALSSRQKDLSSRGCWHIILQVFNGSRDTITPVYQSFSPPISASQIRVVPFSQHPRVVCLRLELHGCRESSKFITAAPPNERIITNFSLQMESPPTLLPSQTC